ncbi:unnamed protein product [Linum trigynum]|uniref:DUF223 domain-containing protein n=1 Tax=Linum trigynum TaxID=586398 RepID=A0AAV2FVV2_9ROSI
MDATLLCNLKGGSREVTLRLRLLHLWFAKNPDGTRVFNHCCLWVDQTGMLIQSLADAAFGHDFERVLRVGVVYVIKSFGQGVARNLYRAYSFDLIMELSVTTTFQACSLPAADFPADSFEVVPYSDLPKRNGYHRILSDVVGRLHSISGIDHQVTSNGSTPKHSLVLENAQGQKADSIEPVIIGVGSLMVGRLIVGQYTCSSSSGTRIVVTPRIPEAYSLTTFFGGARNPVTELAVQFATPEDAAADAQRRTRTIAELLDLYHSDGSVDERHRCGGIIRSVESRSPWYYTSCNMCKKKCSTWRNGNYWCPDNWEISEQHVTIGYKIQLTLRDSTNEARFIVLDHVEIIWYSHLLSFLPKDILVGLTSFHLSLRLCWASLLDSRVFRVLPRDNQEPLLAIESVVHPTVDPSVPQGVTEQGGMLLLAGVPEPSQVSCSAIAPTSSSKGKEKISGTVLPGNYNPTFNITQAARQPLNKSHGPLVIKESSGVSNLGIQSPQEGVSRRAFSASDGVSRNINQDSVFAVSANEGSLPISSVGPPQDTTIKAVADVKIPEIPPFLVNSDRADLMSSCE